ncbi:hypothetical protein [Agromyces bauzanensis]
MSLPDPNDPARLGDRLKRAADAATPGPIDVDAVLTRSRAARRTRRTAVVSGVGAVAGVLAIAGLVLGLPGLVGPTATDGQVALESAESTSAAPEAAAGGASDDVAGSRLVAPYEVNRCGAPVAAPTDAATGPLTATVIPPAGPVPSGAVATVTVTVTNTGDMVVSGTLAATVPITIADAGITVWHSGPGGDLPAEPISLAPGESASLEATLEARSCTASDDLGGPLPDDLPPLGAGEYAVGAVVVITGDADAAVTYLVSPLVPLRVG